MDCHYTTLCFGLISLFVWELVTAGIHCYEHEEQNWTLFGVMIWSKFSVLSQMETDHLRILNLSLLNQAKYWKQTAAGHVSRTERGVLPNWYSFLSLLASTRYLRRVVVLHVLGSFMAVMAAVMASSKVLPFSRTWLPVRFSCDSQISTFLGY